MKKEQVQKKKKIRGEGKGKVAATHKVAKPKEVKARKEAIPTVRKFRFITKVEYLPFTEEMKAMAKENDKRVRLSTGGTPSFIKAILGWNKEWLAAPHNMSRKIAVEAYPILQKKKNFTLNRVGNVIEYYTKKKVFE